MSAVRFRTFRVCMDTVMMLLLVEHEGCMSLDMQVYHHAAVLGP